VVAAVAGAATGGDEAERPVVAAVAGEVAGGDKAEGPVVVAWVGPVVTAWWQRTRRARRGLW
jgi:hypothetical protein